MTPDVDEETVKRLLAVVNEDTSEGTLDDAVSDVKDAEASAINNGGFDNQIRFLLENGESEDYIRGYLET